MCRARARTVLRNRFWEGHGFSLAVRFPPYLRAGLNPRALCGGLNMDKSEPRSALHRTKATTRHPLSGLRVLVGRARHQAGALSSGLRKLGAAVIEIPFIEIRKPRSFRPLDSALKNLREYDWLILTSVNGVEALWDRLKKLHIRKNGLTNLNVVAIGPATKRAIEKRGIHVDVMPHEYVAESVVET